MSRCGDLFSCFSFAKLGCHLLCLLAHCFCNASRNQREALESFAECSRNFLQHVILAPTCWLYGPRTKAHILPTLGWWHTIWSRRVFSQFSGEEMVFLRHGGLQFNIGKSLLTGLGWVRCISPAVPAVLIGLLGVVHPRADLVPTGDLGDGFFDLRWRRISEGLS